MHAQPDARPVVDAAAHDAVIFDMDGVVTDTARVHARAWKRMFDDYLQDRAQRLGETFVEFDIESDYLRYVDGKPRFDGAKSFFESRDIHLPDGTPEDGPDVDTVWGLSMRKQGYFLESLEEFGAEAYDSTLDLIANLRRAGIKTAIITASRNCTEVLASAGVGDIFDARVDGKVAADLGLPGKPAPDVFLEAARRVGATPSRSVVVEDAQSGVAAGRAGQFGLVVGVDRVGQADELIAAGADVVVSDLEEVVVVTDHAPQTPSVGPRPMRDLPSAMEQLDDIRSSLSGRTPVVFLDYDGTLTPIVERPEDAIMSPAMRSVVDDLSSATTVAIVSGRDVAFVRDQVRVDGMLYAGSHGFDIVGPEGLDRSTLGQFARFLPIVDAAEQALATALADVPGARVERKKYSVAAHYRQVPPDQVGRVTAAVDSVIDTQPELRKGLGKKVYEVRPDVDWDKGTAVMWLFEGLGFDAEGAVPFYVGDDITDEDAFEALAGFGIGIAVGDAERSSAAAYRVEDTDQVGAFLEELAAIARGAGA